MLSNSCVAHVTPPALGTAESICSGTSLAGGSRMRGASERFWTRWAGALQAQQTIVTTAPVGRHCLASVASQLCDNQVSKPGAVRRLQARLDGDAEAVCAGWDDGPPTKWLPVGARCGRQRCQIELSALPWSAA